MDQFEGLATAIPVEKFSAGARDVSLPPGIVVKVYATPLVESDVPHGFLSGTVGETYRAKDYPELAVAINQPHGGVFVSTGLPAPNDKKLTEILDLSALASNEIISTGRGRAQKV
jgi:hypothetical protein